MTNPIFPCDICNRCKRTKVVYQTFLAPNDSEEKCEYSCTLYNIPCDMDAGTKCKSVKKWVQRHWNN